MKHLIYLNKFIWKYRNLLFIGCIFIIIANLFALYPAEFVRKAFDAVLLSVNEGTEKSIKIHYTILKYGGLIVIFAILKGVFMFCMRQTIIVMSRKIEFDLKNEIYKQYDHTADQVNQPRPVGGLPQLEFAQVVSTNRPHPDPGVGNKREQRQHRENLHPGGIEQALPDVVVDFSPKHHIAHYQDCIRGKNVCADALNEPI